MPAYDEIHGDLRTGDLVLFSGTGTFSRLIKFASGGKWSHVGLVLVEPGLHAEPLLWEATQLCDVQDVEREDAREGVQLVPLRERVRLYDGEVTCRQLDRPLTAEMLGRLAERRGVLGQRPYEQREVELARAVYDGWGGASPREDLSSIYCAELVAEVYQALGLLPEWPDGLPSNEYVPLDFCEHRALQLLGGYTLGPGITITR
jgi:hypothetical protein